jgi:hypothetical protein
MVRETDTSRITMAGSNMQKAGFCISRPTGKCYVSRSNFVPRHGKSHAYFDQRKTFSTLTDPSAKSF